MWIGWPLRKSNGESDNPWKAGQGCFFSTSCPKEVLLGEHPQTA